MTLDEYIKSLEGGENNIQTASPEPVEITEPEQNNTSTQSLDDYINSLNKEETARDILANQNINNQNNINSLPAITPQEPKDPNDVSFLEDTFRVFGGAARDTVQGTSDLVRDVTGGYVDLPDLPEVAEPTNMLGSFVRDAAGFLVPYTGTLKGIQALSKLNKLKRLDPVTKVGKLTKYTSAGVIAEQMAFSPDEERLSNLIQEVAPNEFTAWLQADDDDTVAMGRLKMAVEGAGMGLAVEGVLKSLGKIKGKFKKVDDRPEKASGEIDKNANKRAADEEVGPPDPRVGPRVPEVVGPTFTGTGSRTPSSPIGPTPTPDPNKAGNINLDKTGTDKKTKQEYKDLADDNDQYFNQRRGRQEFGKNGEKLNDRANELGWTVDDIVNIPKGTALNDVEITRVRQIERTLAEDLAKARKIYLDKIAKNTVTEQDHFNFKKMSNEVAAVHEVSAGVRAEAGRTLRALREISRNPDEKIKTQAQQDFLENAKGTNLDPEIIARNLEAFDDDVDAAIKYIAGLENPTLLNKIQEFWINSLLSSPATHLVNVSSNELTAVMRPLEYFGAAVKGTPKMLTGGERVTYSEAAARLVGTILGHLEGLKVFGKTVFDENAVMDSTTKLELARQKSIGGIGGTIVRTPSRLLVAEDMFFKTIAYRQEIWGQAMRKAAKERKGWNYASQLVKKHGDDPLNSPLGKDIEFDALEVGRYQTFTNKVGEVGRAVNSINRAIPLVRFMLPFVRTPVNIVKYAAERTPFGFSMQRYKDAIAKGGAEKDVAQAKIIMGTSTMLGVGLLANSGLISGAGASMEGEPLDGVGIQNRRQTSEGWEPYSIKVGDKWYRYNRFEPIGILFGIAADLNEVGKYINNTQDDTKDLELEASKVAGMIATSVSNNLTNKTFMSGLSDVIKAISDPTRYSEKWINRFTGSFVPTVFAHAGQYDDDVLRDARSITDTLIQRLPLFGDPKTDLAPRRNIFGEIQTRDPSVGGPFTPYMYSEPKLGAEIFDEFYRLGYSPRLPARNIDGIKLNPFQYSRLLEINGELNTKDIMTNIIKGRDYLNAPEGVKQAILSNVLEEFNGAAKQLLLAEDKELMQQYIEGRATKYD